MNKRLVIESRVLRFAAAIALAVSLLALGTGCATSSGPKPPRERISNLPQNLPQAWEGQSRLGGMPMSY